MCIARKRISFRLFKQWYWESFDDDVQVSILSSQHIWLMSKICTPAMSDNKVETGNSGLQDLLVPVPDEPSVALCTCMLPCPLALLLLKAGLKAAE